MKKKNTISYPKERIELNKMLYEECLKTPLNPTAIQNLLHKGADCLGAIDENPLNYDTHLFGELIYELSMKNGRNLPRITKLFLDAGMDIERPQIPYDGGNSLNPLWELAFCANRNGIRSLKLLLNAGELGFNFRTVYLDFSRVNPYFLYENKGVPRFSTFGHLKLKKLNFNKKVELG